MDVLSRNKLQRYQSVLILPLTILSVIFLILYLLESFDSNLVVQYPLIFEIGNLVIWIVFIFDYLFQIVLSENKWRFIIAHPIELLLVVFPFFRPLRALRLLFIFERLFQGYLNRVTIRLSLYVGGSATIILLLGAAAIYDAEAGLSTAKITTPEEAIWWAFVTVTTVGYGDYYPVTTLGRLIAVALMLTGIAVVGTVTASFAAYIVARVQQEQK